jgi:hypothetical protein
MAEQPGSYVGYYRKPGLACVGWVGLQLSLAWFSFQHSLL